MSEVIKMSGISKRYKLFHTRFAKVLDMLGFGVSGRFDEFWALKGVALTIRKGEKVGFIGRNGAGKTTLLSIIAGNISPTSGEIRVNGKVNALFTLGTGFHPEFSGRENIFSSLAFQGVVGDEATKLSEEIIEFSELGDFIDQPVKTFSAGMYTRLAFAVATVIKPDILIIDEILGAGDAYFAAKALERMKDLTGGGTTVLFVSHDLSAVQKMCDRCIWIDQGKVAFDSDTLSVLKLYSADVRKTEEIRLKAKNMGISKETFSGCNMVHELLIFRLIGKNDTATKTPLPVHRVALKVDNTIISEVLVGGSMDSNKSERAYILTDQLLMNWGQPYRIENRLVRDYRDVGGRYKHAPVIFRLSDALQGRNIVFEIECRTTNTEPILLDVYTGRGYRTLGEIPSGSTEVWKTFSFAYVRGSDADHDMPSEDNIMCEMTKPDVYGTGGLKISGFQILDEDKREQYVLTINNPVIFRIHYRSSAPIENPVFVVAVYSKGGELISQLISKEKSFFVGRIYQEGYVDIRISSLKIGAGNYIVSVGIFHDVDLTSPVEQKAYDLHDRKYFFKVEQPFNVNMKLGLVYQDALFVHNKVKVTKKD